MRQGITFFLIYSIVMGPVFAQPPQGVRPEPGQSWVYHPQHGWGLTDVDQKGMRWTTYYGGTNRDYPIGSGGAPIKVGTPSQGRSVGGGGVLMGGSLYYNPNQKLPALPPNGNVYRSPFTQLSQGGWGAQSFGTLKGILLNPEIKAPQLTVPGGSNLDPGIAIQKQWIESIASTLSAPATAPLVSKYVSAPMLAVAERNPFDLAESLDGYMNQVAALDSVDPKLAQEVVRIGQSVFMDGQGVISGLPDAPRPVDLVSPITSKVGRAVRSNLNRMLVARQVLEGEHRLFCQARPNECVAQELQMGEVRDMFDQLALLNVIAERIGLANDPAFEVLRHELEKAAAFTFGFAKGVYGSVEELATGLAYLLTHNPVNTIRAVGDMLYNYDRTFKAISDSLGKKWDTFLYGSAVEQGEVLGSVTTELLTTVIPGLKGTTGAARALKSAATLENAVMLGEKISLAAKAGTYKILRATVQRAATKVAVSKGIQEFVSKGALAAESAEMLYALNQALPETAAQLMKLEQAGLNFSQLKTAAKEASKVADSAAAADAMVASLIAENGASAATLLGEYGAEALAGAVKAYGPGAVKAVGQWSKSPAAKEMAQMASQVHRELAILPNATQAKNLGSLIEFEALLKTEGFSLTANGREFLVRQTLNAEVILSTEGRTFSTVESFNKATKAFAKFEEAMPNVKGVALGAEESTVWRGIFKEWTNEAGVVQKSTPADVFRTHIGNLKTNHRFSQPGEVALYTTMGSEAKALEIIMAELNTTVKESVLYGKQTVKAEKILDLTNPQVLEALGLTKETLIMEQYTLTHQIGFLARKYGFDAIKTFSAKGDGVNLILPKRWP